MRCQEWSRGRVRPRMGRVAGPRAELEAGRVRGGVRGSAAELKIFNKHLPNNDPIEV
jgi:hypothetical protein